MKKNPNTKTIKLIGIAIFMVVLKSFGYERVKPQIISLENNDQISVTMSKVDLNRIFVDGDKITSINAPSGYFSAHNDNAGNVYVSLGQTRAFTVFISTQMKKNFSILVIPKAEPGKTIEFKFTSQDLKPAKTFSKTTMLIDEKKDLIEVVRNFLKGNIPKNYNESPNRDNEKYQEIFEKKFKFEKKIGLKVKSTLLGKKYTICLIEVYNKSKDTLMLNEMQFNINNTSAVAIKNNLIKPKSSGLVIEVLHNV